MFSIIISHIPSLRRNHLIGLGGLFGLILLSSCSGSGSKIPKMPHNADAETLYNYGIDALHNGHYKLASGEFELLQQNYPYSGYTGNAELMEGYAYYLQGEYALSVQQLERYLQLHPTSPDAAYAYYLRALCYYEQIGDVSRDQLGTAEALDALQEVVARFPQSSYARDAQLKIDLCRDHLAGKEMLVGRFYEQEKDYQAAIGRYQRVVQDFQTTNHVPEALERLVEVNLDLGLKEEAVHTAIVLGYNFPNSTWYHRAYNKLDNHGLITAALRPFKKDSKTHKISNTTSNNDSNNASNNASTPNMTIPPQPIPTATQPITTSPLSMPSHSP